MLRRLVQLGAVLLAIAVWVWLAGAVGWTRSGQIDDWASTAVKLGLVCLALAGTVRVVVPLLRALRGRRCARCGAPATRGGVYCLDHAKQALDELRDRTRPTLVTGRNDRA